MTWIDRDKVTVFFMRKGVAWMQDPRVAGLAMKAAELRGSLEQRFEASMAGFAQSLKLSIQDEMNRVRYDIRGVKHDLSELGRGVAALQDRLKDAETKIRDLQKRQA